MTNVVREYCAFEDSFGCERANSRRAVPPEKPPLRVRQWAAVLSMSGFV